MSKLFNLRAVLCLGSARGLTNASDKGDTEEEDHIGLYFV